MPAVTAHPGELPFPLRAVYLLTEETRRRRFPGGRKMLKMQEALHFRGGQVPREPPSLRHFPACNAQFLPFLIQLFYLDYLNARHVISTPPGCSECCRGWHFIIHPTRGEKRLSEYRQCCALSCSGSKSVGFSFFFFKVKVSIR